LSFWPAVAQYSKPADLTVIVPLSPAGGPTDRSPPASSCEHIGSRTPGAADSLSRMVGGWPAVYLGAMTRACFQAQPSRLHDRCLGIWHESACAAALSETSIPNSGEELLPQVRRSFTSPRSQSVGQKIPPPAQPEKIHHVPPSQFHGESHLRPTPGVGSIAHGFGSPCLQLAKSASSPSLVP